VDSLLGGLAAPLEGRPEAAIAIRSTATLAASVPAQLWEVSSAAFDAQMPWASVAPLLPHVSPEAAQLGQAIDAVLADLDELGGDLFSAVTESDRLAWCLGAGGAAYFVAARQWKRRVASKEAALRRHRQALASVMRRARLSVQPLVH
jgi:hypothetical protein